MVERFASGVTILQDTCPGLVAQIEAGDLDSQPTRTILEKALRPMLTQGIDTIVLGCTHYPFVIPLVKQIVGPNVRVIDPAPAVARQAARLMDGAGLRNGGTHSGVIRFFTSGEAAILAVHLPSLLGEGGEVQQIVWRGNEIYFSGADTIPDGRI